MDPILLAQTFACLFFAAAFLQSSLDKIFDWKGNLGFLQGHFSKTPMARAVPAMLAVVTLLELATGVVSVIGALLLWIGHTSEWATVAMGLAALTLLVLFAGQRIAKDYVGAAVLAAYFAVALIGLWVLAQ